WEALVNHLDLALVSRVDQGLERAKRLCAIWAFEVGKLDDRHGSVSRSQRRPIVQAHSAQVDPSPRLGAEIDVLPYNRLAPASVDEQRGRDALPLFICHRQQAGDQSVNR